MSSYVLLSCLENSFLEVICHVWLLYSSCLLLHDNCWGGLWYIIHIDGWALHSYLFSALWPFEGLFIVISCKKKLLWRVLKKPFLHRHTVNNSSCLELAVTLVVCCLEDGILKLFSSSSYTFLFFPLLRCSVSLTRSSINDLFLEMNCQPLRILNILGRYESLNPLPFTANLDIPS